MKTKKHSIIISSIVSQFILQVRNSSYDQLIKKIQSSQQRINQMHKGIPYSRQLYFQLIDKSQYSIQQKLINKENRILKNTQILIHFKLTQKWNSNISFIESWLVSTERHNVSLKSSKIDSNQELVYLLQQVLQALKCQFLTDFASMGQQFRSGYILDYEIQINPSKKSLKKLYPLHFQHVWKKQAFLDQQNKMSVTCYHNTHRKLQSIITMQKQWSRQKSIKPHVKRGSEQTKPSNSGEYQLSTSIEEKGSITRERKTSMIQFYDEDLNITVLSSDSETFKKSTGRIQGIYTDQDLQKDGNNKEQDSDDQFQLLIQESAQQELQKDNKNKKQYIRIREIEKELEGLLFHFDQVIDNHFF